MIVKQQLFHQTFAAMGTEIEIVLVQAFSGQRSGIDSIAELLAEEWESTFSRFRPDSELSLLNQNAGKVTPVSLRLLNGIQRAMRASSMTSGYFNPFILERLKTLGYDRTFDELKQFEYPVAEYTPLPVPPTSLISIDVSDQSVTLPAGVELDLSGIAKGLYVDELARALSAFPAGVISAGGDIYTWGEPPGDKRWTIGLEDPVNLGTDLLELSITNGAIATSGTNRRRWQRGTVPVHHLVNPYTGLPSTSAAQSVTVIAATAEVADVLATAFFVAAEEISVLPDLQPLFRLALRVTGNGEINVQEGELDLNVEID